MVDWRQIHISLEVGSSRKIVGHGKKSTELDAKKVLKSRGFGELN